MISAMFPVPPKGSRCRRWLKRSGADAPLLTGAWERSATNKHGSVYTEPIACHYYLPL